MDSREGRMTETSRETPDEDVVDQPTDTPITPTPPPPSADEVAGEDAPAPGSKFGENQAG